MSRIYSQERRAFERLKSDCSPECKLEFEASVGTLVERYNTTIYENRFIVGGAVEIFTYALLRSVGIACTLYADQSKGGDILMPNEKKLSVKSSFTGISNVKLLNQMGPGTRNWDTAALFVISGVGIVYGDPDSVDQDAVKSTGDGLELRKAAMVSLVADSENVFGMSIASKPPTEQTGFSQKASTAVALQILQETCSLSLQDAIAQASLNR